MSQDLSDFDLQDETQATEDALFNSPELLGRECQGCQKVLAWKYFQKDSSFKEGYGNLCYSCMSTPRLSLEENTARLREANLRSHAVKKQRWQDQEEYRKDSARVGHRMHSSEFLRKVRKYVPNLYVTEGGVAGDLALFLTYPVPQPRLEGRDFEYLTYLPEGISNEFSTYEFDNNRDVPIREKWDGGRGWRTVLLRFIKKNLITEEQALAEFGPAEGEGSVIYNKSLYKFRNTAAPAA